MSDYIKPLLQKCPDYTMLHAGNNNAVNEPFKVVLDRLFDLKKSIENTFPERSIVISNLITWTDNGKPSLLVTKTNDYLHGLQMDTINNGYITSDELNKEGCIWIQEAKANLLSTLLGELKFATTWRVTGSFHEAWNFDCQVNFRSFINLGNTENSDNRVNGTSSEETLKNDELNEMRKKNLNHTIIADLNINSIRKKFEMLKKVIGNKINSLLISETNLDDAFPLSQFMLEGFTPPYRLDRTEHGGGLILSAREDIPSKLLPNINPILLVTWKISLSKSI